MSERATAMGYVPPHLRGGGDTGEAGDNPRDGATIAEARGTTVEEAAVRRRGAVEARGMRTVVIEDRSVVGAVDEAVGAWRRCLRSGRRARAWRR